MWWREYCKENQKVKEKVCKSRFGNPEGVEKTISGTTHL